MTLETLETLETVNAHVLDKRIRFVEETHTYFVDGSRDGYISTTTLIHKLFPEFNADDVITKMFKSKNWSKSKYNGMSRQDIKDLWDKNGSYAASMGTKMHANIENYYNKQEHETESKEFELFSQFRDDHPNLEPYRTEWVVFDEDSKISGSIDMVFKDPENHGKFIICDWKRSKELKETNRWQNGSSEFTRHLDDTNFVHYSMQLSIYKRILEKNYGIEISNCFIVVLHPSQDRYIKKEIMDLSKEVEALMKSREKGEMENKKRVRADSDQICEFDLKSLK